MRSIAESSFFLCILGIFEMQLSSQLFPIHIVGYIGMFPTNNVIVLVLYL